MGSLTRTRTGRKRGAGTRGEIPAKLTRPQTPAIVFRTRLFNILNAAVNTPVVWIEGPPGAGKTTLVSSYIEQHHSHCLWYQIDAGDADPANFFHYLGLAAKSAAPRSRKELPHLTPEYLSSLSIFTRRYFEELFQRLKAPVLLVFDNYQEVEADAALHRIMADALSILPPGIKVIVISRTSPPANLARLRASGLLTPLGWKDLRLTQEESQEIARMRVPNLHESVLSRVCDQTQGWVAGLVLALERGQQLKDDRTLTTPQAVFDYFAAEIFENMEAEARSILLKCAFLPRVTPGQAEQLTKISKAGNVLTELNARGYFIAKHAAAVYQLHPLFREFLLTRAKTVYDAKTRSELQKNAAVLLVKGGEVADAMTLFIEARDWDSLANTIKQHAQTFLRQGRGQTLQHYLKAFPVERLESDPWLLFWLAQCRLPFDPIEARSSYESAYEQFNEREDATGLYLAWAGIIDTFVFAWSDFQHLDKWITELEKLSKNHPELPSPEIEARIALGMLTALTWRQPHHPRLSWWAERVMANMLASNDPSLRLHLGCSLVIYHTWTGAIAQATTIVKLLEPLSLSSGNDALVMQWWLCTSALYAWHCADHAACMSAIKRSVEIGEKTGVRMFDFPLFTQGVISAISDGDRSTADELMARIAAIDSPRALDKALYHFITASHAWFCGDLRNAIDHGKQATIITEANGFTQGAKVAHIELAITLFDAGYFIEADAELNRALLLSTGLVNAEFLCQLFHSWFALEQGKYEEGIRYLRPALVTAAKNKYVNFSRWRPRMMSKICAIALEHNIEPDYISYLIKFRKLLPPIDTNINLDAWPWPVKITTMGGLYIECDGEPVRFTGKIQYKPLALLKLLLASSGREVLETQLAEVLWPEADGDTARMNLRPVIHRLRKLIGAEALIVEAGRVSLDPSRCWVDAWVLERRLAEISGTDITLLSASDAIQKATGLLALHRGPFLPEDDLPEIISLRERLRVRLLRHLQEIGEQLECLNEWRDAVLLYEEGLLIDPCIESLYCGLMRCNLALGHCTEVVHVYHQCAAALQSRLGLQPSSQAQHLLLLAQLKFSE